MTGRFSTESTQIIDLTTEDLGDNDRPSFAAKTKKWQHLDESVQLIDQKEFDMSLQRVKEEQKAVQNW